MINDKKVIAVTLARGGSKRVPNKNIEMIVGKTLIEYTIEEVKKSKYVDYYIISTDSDAIANAAKKNMCNVIYRKDVDDTQTSAEGLIKTLMVYQFDENEISDDTIIVEIMPTNPLKTVEDIDRTIEKIFDGDSSVSVVRIWDHHPSRVKRIKNGYLEDFWPEVPESRRQDLDPPAYVRNGSIYVMWYVNLLINETRLCGKIVPYIMPEDRTINIDEPIDLELAKLIISRK